MDQDKARTFLKAERDRLQSALKQLNTSDEQLRTQSRANLEQREEITARIAIIDAALAPTEAAPDAG